MAVLSVFFGLVLAILDLEVRFHLTLHAAVPVVLNGVVGAAVQLLSDLCPSVALSAVLQQNAPVKG